MFKCTLILGGVHFSHVVVSREAPANKPPCSAWLIYSHRSVCVHCAVDCSIYKFARSSYYRNNDKVRMVLIAMRETTESLKKTQFYIFSF